MPTGVANGAVGFALKAIALRKPGCEKSTLLPLQVENILQQISNQIAHKLKASSHIYYYYTKN